MTQTDIQRESRKDLKELHRGLGRILGNRTNEYATEANTAEVIRRYSAAGNEWLLVIGHSGSTPTVYTIALFTDKAGNTSAFWTMKSGLSILIDAHVIEHYARRFHPNSPTSEHLNVFFSSNYLFPIQVEQVVDTHVWNVSIGLQHGLGMGVWNVETDIVHFNTILIKGQAYSEAPIVPEQVDIDRLFKTLSPEERLAFLDRAGEETKPRLEQRDQAA